MKNYEFWFVVGSQFLYGPEVLETVKARAEVILSAGAINTPKIMQFSGLGPAALLQQHGIHVLRDMAGVGENLQDHLQIRTVYKVDGARTLNTMANRLVGKAGYGEVLRTLARRGDWIRVRSEGGVVGWVARRLTWGW